MPWPLFGRIGIAGVSWEIDTNQHNIHADSIYIAFFLRSGPGQKRMEMHALALSKQECTAKANAKATTVGNTTHALSQTCERLLSPYRVAKAGTTRLPVVQYRDPGPE